jgi:hypothetical protein
VESVKFTRDNHGKCDQINCDASRMTAVFRTTCVQDVRSLAACIMYMYSNVRTLAPRGYQPSTAFTGCIHPRTHQPTAPIALLAETIFTGLPSGKRLTLKHGMKMLRPWAVRVANEFLLEDSVMTFLAKCNQLRLRPKQPMMVTAEPKVFAFTERLRGIFSVV